MVGTYSRVISEKIQTQGFQDMEFPEIAKKWYLETVGVKKELEFPGMIIKN